MDFSQKDGMTDAIRQALRKLKLPELNQKLVDGKTLSGQFLIVAFLLVIY